MTLMHSIEIIKSLAEAGAEDGRVDEYDYESMYWIWNQLPPELEFAVSLATTLIYGSFFFALVWKQSRDIQGNLKIVL